MKARGLLSLLFGLAALAGALSEAQARALPAAHTFVRPLVVAPHGKPHDLAAHGNPHARIGWGCNPRRFGSASFYSPSWYGYSAYPQQDAPSVEAAPPVVNNVFLEAPAAAPPPQSLGPRFITVDRKAFARPQSGAPLVIYGDAPESEH